jgi:hypothetical protein
MWLARSPMRLQVGGDLERCRDQAEIARRRLMQRQQLDAQLVDLDVDAVDRVVAVDGEPGERIVALAEGAYGPARSGPRPGRPSRG